MADFPGLPNEVIAIVAGYVHPNTLVPFACSSKRVFTCCKSALAMHKERIARLTNVHDRHPMSMLNLFREIQSSPEVGWYIRVMEFFEFRTGWSSWTSTVLVSPELVSPSEGIEEPEPTADLSDLDRSIYTDEEIEAIEQILYTVFHLSEVDVRKHMDQLFEGSEEALKAAVMANCPMLANIVYFAYNTAYGTSPKPFNLLSSAIRNTYKGGHAWQFLENVRKVSIDEPTHFRHPHDAMFVNMDDVGQLWLLPSLEEITWHNVSDNMIDGDWDVELMPDWPPGVSTCSVLNLVIYCAETPRLASDLVRYCNRLQKYSGTVEKATVRSLLARSSDTLKQLWTNGRGEDEDSEEQAWSMGLELVEANSRETPLGFKNLGLVVVEIDYLDDPRVPADSAEALVYLPLGQVLGESTHTLRAIGFELPSMVKLFHEGHLVTMFLAFLRSEKPRKLKTICFGWDIRSSTRAANDPTILDKVDTLQEICTELSICLHLKWQNNNELCEVCQNRDPWLGKASATLPPLPVTF